MRAWKRFLSSGREGNFAIMTALVSPVIVVLSAFAVDAGSFYLERREAQNFTDLAALVAARTPAAGQAAAVGVFVDNGWDSGAQTLRDGATVAVVAGRYTADPSLPSGRRFSPGATPANAVEVEFTGTAKRFFSTSLIDAPVIRTRAVATMAPRASLSIGSRLAGLQGGVANRLLTALLGTNASLSLMDYRALLETNVDALAFVEQAGIRAGLDAATYDEVLDSEIAVRDLLGAISHTPGVGLPARTALDTLARTVPATRSLELRRLLDLGSLGRNTIGGIGTDLDVGIAAVPLISAAAGIANGQNQISLDLGASVPGLLALTAKVAIGEPPQSVSAFAIGPEGLTVRTAQTRIRLDARAGPVLGIGVNIPFFVDVAYGEAKIAGISCPAGHLDTARVDVEARPGIVALHLADARIADMHDFSKPPHMANAEILRVPVLLTVDARAHADATNLKTDLLHFDARQIAASTPQHTSTRNALDTLTRSLMSNLKLNLRPLGLGIGIPSGLTSTLGALVGSTLGIVDDVLVELLGVLGVTIGEAEIRVHHVECGRPTLVQ